MNEMIHSKTWFIHIGNMYGTLEIFIYKNSSEKLQQLILKF